MELNSHSLWAQYIYAHDHEMRGSYPCNTHCIPSYHTVSVEGWSTSNKEDLVFYASYRQLHYKIIYIPQ